MSINKSVAEIQQRYGLIGRERELSAAIEAISIGKHLLIEGEVGVGKTTLAIAVAKYLKRKVYRVDASEQYDTNKLVGWFDPPMVLKNGYCWETFIPGPLTLAMTNGGVLFINEVNRLPEDTQNILLPVMDEGILIVPKIGEIKAGNGFVIIATQNPEEYVGVTLISEALKDRFVWLKLNYQPEQEEIEIVKRKTGRVDDETARKAVRIVRKTRSHGEIRRGASIRAAIDLAGIMSNRERKINSMREWIEAAVMALATRIELKEDTEKSINEVIKEIVLSELTGGERNHFLL